MTQDTKDVVALLVAIHRARYPEGRVPEDFAEQDAQSIEYCARIARAVEKHFAADRQSLSDRIDVLEGAANGLVAKLDECEPHIANAFAMEHFRGRPYSGPQYKDALDALRAALHQEGIAP